MGKEPGNYIDGFVLPLNSDRIEGTASTPRQPARYGWNMAPSPFANASATT
jgi:hypothetical protein